MSKKTIAAIILMIYLFNGFILRLNAEVSDPDFRQLFDHHGSVMLITNSETGAIEYANKAAGKFYGYSVLQLESMTLYEICTLSKAESEKIMRAAANEHGKQVLSHRLANGEIRDVAVIFSPYAYNNKAVLFLTIFDITEEIRLRNSRRVIFRVLGGTITLLLLAIWLLLRFYKLQKDKNQEIQNFSELQKTFMNADKDLVYLKDESLRYIFVNQAFALFFNKSPSEIIGHNAIHLGDEEYAIKSEQADRKVLEKKTHTLEEMKWKDKVLEYSRFPVRLIHGGYGVGAFIRDVTEEYQNKRRQQKRLFRNKILVNTLGRHFSSTQEQLDYVLDEILKLTESRFGYIYIYDEKNQEFELSSWSEGVMAECAVKETTSRYHLMNTGIWGEAVRQRKPIVINDFEKPNPMKKGYPQGHVRLTRFMSVPVVVDDHIFAVVGLANKEDPYDENDIYQVTALMKGVWDAKEKRERSLELEKANVSLRENEARLKLILDSAYEAIYGIDMEGRCTFCNESCLKLLGYAHQDELKGKRMHEQIHYKRRDGTTILLEDCEVIKSLTEGLVVRGEDEIFWRADGSCFDVEYFSHPQYWDGKIIGAVVTFLDITERKKTEREIAWLSYHDSLTGLYNRRFFEEELDRLDTPRNLPLSIIMGDVNGLKLTNDVFGHAAGDSLLRRAADTIRSVCRREDIMARWGGDEYIIILPKTTGETAETIAKRIGSAFAGQRIKGLNGSISLGCGTKEQIEEGIYKAIEKAEEKMYLSKTLNRQIFNRQTMTGIMQALHEMSPEESQHSERISRWCEKTGRAMNLPEDQIKRLKDAGYLHDIGKIAVEEALLNKRGELTPQEHHEMSQHPVIGYRILNSSEETLELAGDVLSHHEAWNGTGYPKGLKGEDIPLPSRIIAVAEAYEALRETTGREEALVELGKRAGSQLDPAIVEAFVSMIAQESR